MDTSSRPFLFQKQFMKTPEEILHSAGETVEYARQYIHQQGDIIRLEAAERTAKVTSSLITAMVLGIIGLLVLVMLSIAIGFWLSSITGSPAKAFLIIAIAYIIIGTLLFFFRRAIITNPSLDFVLDAFFDQNDQPS